MPVFVELIGVEESALEGGLVDGSHDGCGDGCRFVFRVDMLGVREQMLSCILDNRKGLRLPKSPPSGLNIYDRCDAMENCNSRSVI